MPPPSSTPWSKSTCYTTLRDDADRSRKVIDILEDERLRRAVEVERLRSQLVKLSEEVTGKDPYSGSTYRLYLVFKSTRVAVSKPDRAGP